MRLRYMRLDMRAPARQLSRLGKSDTHDTSGADGRGVRLAILRHGFRLVNARRARVPQSCASIAIEYGAGDVGR